MTSETTSMQYTHDTSDGRNRLIWTKDQDNNVTIYGYGAEGIVWSLCNGEYMFYHYDYRGSVTAITDIDGSVTDTVKYDVYGAVAARTGDSELILGYNGEYGVLTDPSGLLYMRTRYYSTELKRFLSADVINGSISDSTTLNLYTYVNGNPISFVDPFGLSAERSQKYENYTLGGWDLAPEFGPYDDYFPYDPNEVATAEDYILWLEWIAIAEASRFATWLPDASVAYNHYMDSSGTDLWIDYERAYKEDSVISAELNAELVSMIEAAEYFYFNNAGNSFEIIGDLFPVYNGDTENWQKTIGAHYTYAHGDISIDTNKNKASMVVTFTMEDMYNFNAGGADIASGVSDNVNGRFSVLGWAKQFKTYGSFSMTASWDIGGVSKAEDIKFGSKR